MIISIVHECITMMTGAATWQFSHDLCNLNTNEPKHLKMTVCSNDEFTCARVRKD